MRRNGQAGEHFIELATDFSNVDDVLHQFRDTTLCQTMVDRAYDHIRASHTYDHRMAALHEALAALS